MQKIIFLTIVFGILGGNACAEIFKLGKIEVLGSTEEIKINSHIVTSDDLNKYEKKTLLEALDMVPGINIYNSGGRNEGKINVRGFNSRYVPLFIDGIPIAVAYDGQVNFSRFTTFDLSEIEISKGLTSPLLGANTFAGAINLVTKRPTKKFEGIISLGTFTGDGKKAYMNFGTNQELYYVQASSSFLSRNNYPLSDAFQATPLQQGDTREQSDTEDKKLNFKIGYTPNETDEYVINYMNQKADQGIPAVVFPSERPRFWDWNYWDKESIYFLSKTNFKSFYFKTRLFHDNFKNNLSRYTDNTYSVRKGNPSWYDDNTKGISLEFGQLNSEKNTIKVALHAKKDTHIEGEITVPVEYEMNVNTYSIGIENTLQLTKSTTIVIGASFDKDDVTRADNSEFGSTGNYGSSSGATDISGFGTLQEFKHAKAEAFNPILKIKHDINEGFKIYGGVAKKTRMPSLKDRYSFRLGMFIPNENLKEEEIINYEVGIQKYFNNSYVKGSVFYADVDDFIQSTFVNVWLGEDQQRQLQNIGEVTQKGLELEYALFLDNGLDFNANYTRLLIEDKDKLVKITNVPKDKVVLALSYEVMTNLITNFNMHYSSSQKTQEKFPFKETGSMVVWNVKIIYDITKQASFDFGVINMFDKNFQFDYGYPEAGRTFFTNLTYNF